MTVALMFPGQGSQAVGMGKALAEEFTCARAVFDEVDAALGQNLSRLMFDGPEPELTLTANAQPALMAVSLAAFRVLQAETGLEAGEVACLAGHSLGEYSALAVAGSIGLSDAARLLRTRGDAMQHAAPAGLGVMAALIGIGSEKAAAIAVEAAQGQVCQMANDNGGGQIVISGHGAAVGRAIAAAKACGARRAVLLPVSAPFHSALMRPAAEIMAAALAEVMVRTPKAPVVANVLARPVHDPQEIRRCLVEQVTGAVRWRESVIYMAEQGATRFLEIGSGKVLSALLKRIIERADALAVGTPQDVAAAKAARLSTHS